jgi:hypothetical protein
LSRANLSGANLSDANLSRADLGLADLRLANLSRADLGLADLSDANLSRADLSRADLSDANLRLADLSDANLSRANLSRADLSRANLRLANLSDAEQDLCKVLDAAPMEVAGLRAALVAGKVNGSCYEGECACLLGTIANLRYCAYTELGALTPDSSRPAERFFLAILPGCTPENSQPCALAVKWIDSWLSKQPNA